MGEMPFDQQITPQGMGREARFSILTLMSMVTTDSVPLDSLPFTWNY
jgi:hypothetical protein